MSMHIVDHMKRILGIGCRVQPVLMEDVPAADQDPQIKEKQKQATNDLVYGIKAAERKSWEVRKALASGALNHVIGRDIKND